MQVPCHDGLQGTHGVNLAKALEGEVELVESSVRLAFGRYEPKALHVDQVGKRTGRISLRGV
jgi:hypothetical protein